MTTPVKLPSRIQQCADFLGWDRGYLSKLFDASPRTVDSWLQGITETPPPILEHMEKEVAHRRENPPPTKALWKYWRRQRAVERRAA